jgi:nucleotide-binding universal stress UspA family protein
MKQLVVGFDGSDESRCALRWAASVAEASSAPLVVVEAWSYSSFSIFGAGGDLPPPHKMDDRVRRDLVQSTADVLDGSRANIEVKFEALRGSPAGAILQGLTEDSGLVLGSRGRGGFAGLLLGSVSRECIEHAPSAQTYTPWKRKANPGWTW